MLKWIIYLNNLTLSLSIPHTHTLSPDPSQSLFLVIHDHNSVLRLFYLFEADLFLLITLKNNNYEISCDLMKKSEPCER